MVAKLHWWQLSNVNVHGIQYATSAIAAGLVVYGGNMAFAELYATGSCGVHVCHLLAWHIVMICIVL